MASSTSRSIAAWCTRFQHGFLISTLTAKRYVCDLHLGLFPHTVDNAVEGGYRVEREGARNDGVRLQNRHGELNTSTDAIFEMRRRRASTVGHLVT